MVASEGDGRGLWGDPSKQVAVAFCPTLELNISFADVASGSRLYSGMDLRRKGVGSQFVVEHCAPDGDVFLARPDLFRQVFCGHDPANTQARHAIRL